MGMELRQCSELFSILMCLAEILGDGQMSSINSVKVSPQCVFSYAESSCLFESLQQMVKNRLQLKDTELNKSLSVPVLVLDVHSPVPAEHEVFSGRAICQLLERIGSRDIVSSIPLYQIPETIPALAGLSIPELRGLFTSLRKQEHLENLIVSPDNRVFFSYEGRRARIPIQNAKNQKSDTADLVIEALYVLGAFSESTCVAIERLYDTVQDLQKQSERHDEHCPVVTKEQIAEYCASLFNEENAIFSLHGPVFWKGNIFKKKISIWLSSHSAALPLEVADEIIPESVIWNILHEAGARSEKSALSIVDISKQAVSDMPDDPFLTDASVDFVSLLRRKLKTMVTRNHLEHSRRKAESFFWIRDAK
eukprot:ANDGO_08038.mRNA.1 hypothetical protein